MADLKHLVLSARDVHELLPYGECADLVAGGLAALARGEVCQPLRTMVQPPAARTAAADAVDPARRGRGSRPGRRAQPQGVAGVPVRAAGSAAETVTGADIVVTATSSATPVLERAWVADGTHINAVGACLPHTRELDSATMAAPPYLRQQGIGAGRIG